METMQAIQTRRSIRNYNGRQISEEQLDNLLIAACAAPIAMAQFTDITITTVQASGVLKRIDENTQQVMGEPNTASPTGEAPTLIIISSREPVFADANVACMIENMMLAATSMGLGSLYLWGVVQALRKTQSLLQELELSEDFLPIAAMAVGYTDQPLEKRTINVSKITHNRIR